ncbi:MAG: FAD-dependent oxidoreductase [Acetatifactor sp.]|nr:FAD-dependent oxidoreductase [Acetatifactor sp.]
MLRLNQVKAGTEQDVRLDKRAAEVLQVPLTDILSVRIVRQSIDARKKPQIFYNYTLDVEVKNQERVLRKFRGRENLVSLAEPVVYHFPEPGKKRQEHAPVIVGMGPAGLFCGYFLALHGYRPILLERGKCVEERQEDVERFWETGKLAPNSNVQFGEGGAGAFSDGKLNTLVKDRDGRNSAILETLVRFGAKESICYDAKPHIGTDVLCQVVGRMRREIIRLGGTVRFSSCMTGIETREGRVAGVIINEEELLPCSQVVLACGHSARDTFAMLYEKGVPMEAKAFAVGLRVEHPQVMINECQYGKADPGALGAAPYKVTAQASNGRGVYSFCMCPGGYVVNASSEKGRTAVNGMSYSGRGGRNANSAVIVSVTPEDFGSDHPLAGIDFQRQLEEKAFELGKGRIPVQRYGEFRERVVLEQGGETAVQGSASTQDKSVTPYGAVGNNVGEGDVSGEILKPQCKGSYVWADVSRILPKACNEAFVEGMMAFGRQIRGFDRPDVVLSGVESRTSSPVRICRDESLQSVIRGLYPCGEGAGYAGGITSAAMDGLRVAEAIAAEYMPGCND